MEELEKMIERQQIKTDGREIQYPADEGTLARNMRTSHGYLPIEIVTGKPHEPQDLYTNVITK